VFFFRRSARRRFISIFVELFISILFDELEAVVYLLQQVVPHECLGNVNIYCFEHVDCELCLYFNEAKHHQHLLDDLRLVLVKFVDLSEIELIPTDQPIFTVEKHSV
jgi:hypothetical protein